MLIASHLRKQYASVVAVEDVSLKVERGEILGLLGPNGAGKTTTIRMVLNIVQPDAGKITFDGELFSERTRNIVGYLPEERGLYRKSRLLNTLLYFASLKQIDRAEAKRRAYYWLQRFDLVAQFDRRLEELSKGNQQKVQFIISILHDPQLIVLDEPFSGLDPLNQILLKDVLMEMKQKGKAIVFSTHQMEEAERLCDKICLINVGRVVVDGVLREIKSRYGRNAIHIAYSGDGAFLGSLHCVKKALIYENFAELVLENDRMPPQLLRELSEKLEIRTFEIQEPSLKAIFLDLVNRNTANQTVKEMS